MKVALLTTDNREPFKQYNKVEPWFGTAPEALLQGFAQLPEVEVHVVSCIRRPVKSPEKIAPNIFFHSLVVPKLGWMSTLYQGCIRATRKKLRDIQPDIVHGQGTELDSSVGDYPCRDMVFFDQIPHVIRNTNNPRGSRQCEFLQPRSQPEETAHAGPANFRHRPHVAMNGHDIGETG